MNIRTITILFGAIGLSSTCLGVLFRLMHWPGKYALLTIGLSCLSVAFLLVALYLLKKEEYDKKAKNLEKIREIRENLERSQQK